MVYSFHPNVARGNGPVLNSLTSGLGRLASTVGHAVRNALPVAIDVLADHARTNARSYFDAFKKDGLSGVYREMKSNIPKVASDVVRHAIAANGSIAQSIPQDIRAAANGWPLPSPINNTSFGSGPFIGAGPFVGSGFSNGPLAGYGPFLAGLGPYGGPSDVPHAIGLNVEGGLAKHMPVIQRYLGHLPFLARVLDDLQRSGDIDTHTQQRLMEAFFQMRHWGRIAAATELFSDSMYKHIEAFLASIEHMFMEIITMIDSEDIDSHLVRRKEATGSLAGGSILGTIGSILSPLAGLVLGPAASSIIHSIGSAFGSGVPMLGSHGHGIFRPLTAIGQLRYDGSGLERHMHGVMDALREPHHTHKIVNMLLPGLGRPLASHPTHLTLGMTPVHHMHKIKQKKYIKEMNTAITPPKTRKRSRHN
jgi:hypothetical protein